MKLGIVVDSSCGLSKKEVEARGWYFLPLYINIDGKEYVDGVDIDADTFYKIANIKMNVRSSATPPGIIMDVLEKASKENDGVIAFPLSFELSSQTSNIRMLTRDLKNVRVLKSWGMGDATVGISEQIIKFAETEDSLDVIEKFGNERNNTIDGILVPKHMDWLVKGGRISPAAAKMAGMLKIVPVIGFHKGQLIKHGKGRTFEKTLIKAARQVVENNPENNKFTILNCANEDVERIRKLVLGIDGINNLEIKSMPPAIGIHTGKGACCVMSYKE